MRWLEYAERRSLLVVSRDGFVLWSRSSKSALRTGAYYRTTGSPPIKVPGRSLAAAGPSSGAKLIVELEDAWFGEPATEISVKSDRYDFTISLIHLHEDLWKPLDCGDGEPDDIDLMRGV